MCQSYVATLEEGILDDLDENAASFLCDCIEKGQRPHSGSCSTCIVSSPELPYPYQYACDVCKLFS